MADKTGVKNRRGCGLGLGDGRNVGRIQLAANPRRLAEEDVQRLLKLKAKYKVRLERELRENQMHGVTFVIAKVLDELFDEIGKVV